MKNPKRTLQPASDDMKDRMIKFRYFLHTRRVQDRRDLHTCIRHKSAIHWNNGTCNETRLTVIRKPH